MAAPAPAPVAAVKVEQKGFLDLVKDYITIPIDKSLLQIAPELGHLAPVILSIGTAFLALLTLNVPLAFFAGSSFEASLVYNVIKIVSDYSITPTLGLIESPVSDEKRKACQSHFQSLSPSRFRWFMEEGLKKTFPNQALYFISFAASYCIQSMLYLSEETSALGPQYSNRPYLALMGAGMFIALYAIYLLSFGCDGYITVALSIVLGVFVGFLISNQNALLFGKDSVNLLFLPTMERKTGMDYVCVTTKQS